MDYKKHYATKTNIKKKTDDHDVDNDDTATKNERRGDDADTTPEPKSEPQPGLAPPPNTECPPLNFAEKLKIFRRNVKKSFRTLVVLLWIHFRVRLKRCFATLSEFIIPFIFFLILLIIITIPTTMSSEEGTLMAENEVALQRLASPHLVLYTPENDFTRSLMSKVGKNLHLEPLMFFPGPTSRGHYGFFEFTKYIVKLISHMNSKAAVIIFQSTDGNGTIPQSLTYTIRTKTNFMDESLARFKSEIEVEAQNENGGTNLMQEEMTEKVPELYLRIQWAIDSSFIKLQSENEMKLNKEREREQSKSDTELPVVSLAEYLAPDQRDIYLKLLMGCLMIMGLVSLLVPFTVLMATLTKERVLGIQELMKQSGVSYSMWACSHAINMAIDGLLFASLGNILIYFHSSKQLAIKTFCLYNFFNFILYFHSVLSFAFPLSFLSRTGKCAVAMSTFMYICIYLPHHLLKNKELHTIVHVLTGFFPHVPFYWFLTELSFNEEKFEGLEFEDFFTSHTKKGLSAVLAYIYMILQIILNMLLAAYLTNVAPGKYGLKKPINYLCKVSTKEDKAAATVLQQTGEEETKRDTRFFEDSKQVPSDVVIYIDHVTKIFGNNVALSNVTFPVYKGEITILLGHNEAGKTTLMSIITGMLTPTRGRVLVNGKDVSQDQNHMKNSVGWCSQNNLLFQYLNCREHVRIFAMLKGVSFKQAKLDATQRLQEVGLGDELSAASTLSGGQKIRLQLACALTGNSQILILDEPFAGFDVENRKELWDLLLSLRGNRTVLLSTHMMDEASALGDRVVAMHRGQLKGHATPVYLKKNIGSGYRLSLTTDGFPKTEEITKTVQSVVPSASMKESSYNSVSYNLPSQDNDKFSQLFSKLESEREELKIQAMGVGMSSLEEVFLELCSDIDTKPSGHYDVSKTRDTQYHKRRGCPLYLRQMQELLKRHYRFILFNKYVFLVFLVILPILLMALIVCLFAKPFEGKRRLNLLELFKPSVLYHGGHPLKYNVVDGARRTYGINVFCGAGNVTEAIRRTANSPLIKDTQKHDSHKYVLGIDLNDTHAKLSYSKLLRQATPVALNLLSNILATQRRASAGGKTITTYYQPLVDPPKYNETETMMSVIPVVLILFGVIMCTAMYSVALLTTEQESGARHIHLMTGCPPAVIWLTTLLFHTILYTAIALIPTTLLLLIDTGGFLNQPSFMFAFFVILFVGLVACLLFFYALSFHMSKSKFGNCLFVVVNFAALISGLIKYQMTNEQTRPRVLYKFFADVFYCISPVATTTTALLRATYIARLNKFCYINLHACPVWLRAYGKDLQTTKGFRGFNAIKCCKVMKGTMCILCSNNIAAGSALLLLFAQIFFYGIIVLLTQYGIFNGLKDRILNCKYHPLQRHCDDKNVNTEKLYVEGQAYGSPKELHVGEDAMIVKNLHKRYPKLRRSKRICAVNGVNFSVKKGECFGILGANGAGKSTTLKMIVAQEVATRGTIYANGHFLKWPRNREYMKSLGYCPQFSGLDEFMTGRQNLNLVLVLRGLSDKDVNIETQAWIQVVGLELYQDVLVANYSVGSMRLLATACALSSGGAVTLLDEPTTRVDVSARRRLWNALSKGLRSDRSVIITSHSIDEMEALCSRIAIMSAGEICAFGTVPQLRAEYASGHTLRIKTRIDATGGNLQNLKTAVLQTFDCSLKDEHDTMLRCHINRTMHYSELFTKLEALKQEHTVMEDYSVTETTLEEVFLSFAKPHQKEPGISNSYKNKYA